MQIYKTTSVTPARADTVDQGSNPAQPEDSTLSNELDSFFGEEEVPTEAPVATNPFDLLFASSQVAPGTNANGRPSTELFSPARVVTLKEWLMAYPDGRFFLDKFILKMEGVRDKRYQKRLDNFKKALDAGGMTASEVALIQKQMSELEKAITKINGEIEKTKQMIESNQVVYEQELAYMKDLNLDGFIGDRNDKENSLIVAKHPVTGKEVLLNHNKQPAVDTLFDPKSMPALVDKNNLSIATNPMPVEEDQTSFDAALQLNRHTTLDAYNNSTFGAQIDISAPEGFWVKKDPATGKPLLKEDPENKGQKYEPKPLESVKREDGKEMIGQKPPQTDEERKEWIFVRVTDLNIFSEPLHKEGDRAKGGHVFYEFKDRKQNVVMRLRIEGYKPPQPPSDIEKSLTWRTGMDYVSATTVGIAVNGGAGKHSSRIRPMNIDAHSFYSTGRVYQHSKTRYEQLGIIDHYDSQTGKFIKPDLQGSKKENDSQRGVGAANYTLDGGFGPVIGPLYASKDYPSDYKTGIFIKDIRGNITGTAFNDIIVVPEPNDEKIREILPHDISKITPEHPAYATVVQAIEGRNIVVSEGGDIYASGVTAFFRNSKQAGDHIVVKTNNDLKSKDKNHRIYLSIQGKRPDIVAIDNDGDATDKPGQENGNPDDWFGTPMGTLWTAPLEDADLPSWIDQDVEVISKTEIRDVIKTAATKLSDNVVHLDPLTLMGDDKTEWETSGIYGKQAKELDEWVNSFFAEWEFFSGETNEIDEIEEAQSIQEEIEV